MSIALTYLNVLKAWLQIELISSPPASGTFGLIQVGVLKDDPTYTPAVLTLHMGDPVDQGRLFRERIDNQMSPQTGVLRHQVIGGARDMGGGDHYWYHFTAIVKNYLIQSGLTQSEAGAQNDQLIIWLENKILAAQPWVLGLTSVTGETLQELIYEDNRTVEMGGPPTSWIWHTTIHWKGLVYRE